MVQHGGRCHKRSLVRPRYNQRALVCFADGIQLPYHTCQAAVDLAVVTLVAEERTHAGIRVWNISTLSCATNLREGSVQPERIRAIAA